MVTTGLGGRGLGDRGSPRGDEGSGPPRPLCGREAKEHAVAVSKVAKRFASMLQSELTRVSLASAQVRAGLDEVPRGNSKKPQPEPDTPFGNSS